MLIFLLLKTKLVCEIPFVLICLFFIIISRSLSSSAVVHANAGGEGWLSKLLHVRKIEPGKDSHSKLLSDTEKVYELQSILAICLIILFY